MNLHLAICGKISKLTDKFSKQTPAGLTDAEYCWLANEYLTSAFMALVCAEPTQAWEKELAVIEMFANIMKIFENKILDDYEPYGTQVTTISYLLLCYHHLKERTPKGETMDERIMHMLLSMADRLRGFLGTTNKDEEEFQDD